MEIDNLLKLKTLIEMLRANNILYYKDNEVELQFNPTNLPELPAIENKPKKIEDVEDLLFASVPGQIKMKRREYINEE